MEPTSERDIAALLIVAIESGLLARGRTVAAVDREIAAREHPAKWLIDASLANTPDDLLSALRLGAGDHPALSDLAVWVDAAEAALTVGHGAEAVGSKLLCVEWPDELTDLMYQLDEGLSCAPHHGGPSAMWALRKVLDEVARRRGRSEWRDALEDLTR